ncbi:putative phage minor tail protein [Xanthomonas phage Xp15]|uniref:Putative phage minor tail protein n=1 Tax=Xanthomonas phage Xp15 TaxID=322855 RepID=Q52PK9_9CAUD|nr:minor tail protein [Xanthomonas phage Xp15]AAX84863.1 putative phage minor tail protein [Xanthomonas phage Xp15]
MDAYKLDPFVGVKFNKDTMDCADLVMKIRRELFDHDIILPQGHPRGPLNFRQIGDLSKAFAELTTRPEDGDLVLMKDGGTEFPGHVGVWFFVAYVPYVLHVTEKLKFSMLDKLSDLPDRGLRLEGIYRWK